MPNYSKGTIYKLYNDDAPDLFYYGSTTQRLSQRLGEHRRDVKNKSCTSSILFNVSNNVKIELIEYFSCTDKYELEKRERYYIENNNCVNKQIPGRSDKEYKIDNKDRINQYKIDNKDKIKQQKKQYQNDNQTKIKEFQKQHYQNNKDKRQQYTKYINSHFGILCRNYF